MARQPAPSSPGDAPRSDTDAGDLLNRVLQQTMLSSHEDADEEGSQLSLLRGAASGSVDQPLSEAGVASLVFAVVMDHFKPPAAEAHRWRTIADQVSKTMMNNPAARERLERLWQRLGHAN